MAVCVQVTFPEATLEEYDKVMEQLDLGRSLAPGLRFHVAGASDRGLDIVDVWDSREQFDQFFTSRLGEAMNAAGMSGEPQIREYAVHNMAAAAPATA